MKSLPNRITTRESHRIDLLRLSLIILLLMLHFGGLYNSDYDSRLGYVGQDFAFASLFVSFIAIVALTAVPTLSVISGYLFFLGSDPARSPDFSKKIRKRIRSLMLPFILWSSLYIFLSYFVFDFYPNKFEIIDEVWAPENGNRLEAFFNGWLAINGFPLASQFWFTRDLLVVIIMSPLIWIFLRMAPITFISAIFVLWIFSINTYIFLRLDVLFFFSVGALFSIYDWKRDINYIYIVIACCLFFSMVVFRVTIPYFIGGTYEHLFYIYECIMRIVGVLVFWNLSSFLIFTSIGGFLIKYSYLSFFIYCAHFPTILVLKEILGKSISPDSNASHICVYFITIFALIFCIVISACVLKGISKEFFSLLSGGRSDSGFRCEAKPTP